MPSVAKTSAPKILAAARRLVQRGGVEALSMQSVAEAVGVRAPSLYKHFADRATLLHAIRADAAGQMLQVVVEAGHGEPRNALHAIAHAQRSFALRSPHLYGLVMSAKPGPDLSAEENSALLGPLLTAMRRFAEPKRVLESARLLVAFVHGFSQMESAGAFRQGGNLDAAFEFGVTRILDALSRE